jgi:hypothetical protein
MLNVKLLLAATVVCFGAVCIGQATAASGGHVLGGVTKQGWPVEFELTSKQNQVKQVTVGLDLNCTSGDVFSRPDGYRVVAIKRSGSFSSSFSGFIQDIGNGQTTLSSGHMSGKLNRARTRVTGKWQLHVTFRDNNANPVDQCDSGTVSFSAKD